MLIYHFKRHIFYRFFLLHQSLLGAFVEKKHYTLLILFRCPSITQLHENFIRYNLRRSRCIRLYFSIFVLNREHSFSPLVKLHGRLTSFRISNKEWSVLVIPILLINFLCYHGPFDRLLFLNVDLTRKTDFHMFISHKSVRIANHVVGILYGYRIFKGQPVWALIRSLHIFNKI